MAPKKILLWHWGRRGGGPRYTFELARALKEQGDFELHLSLSRQSEIFNEFEALALPSFHVDTYDNLSSAVFASLRLPAIRRNFWRYVKDHKIDAVICTMSHLWNVPMLIARKNKTPYLMVLHDALPHPGDDVPLRHWLLAKEINTTDGIVALTEHVRGLLCNFYQYPKERSWVVPHGVFPYALPAARTGSKTLRLLFFGRILPYKGLDLLLDAYGMLRAKNYNVELLIAGHGDLHPYAEQLKGLEGLTLLNRWIREEEIGPIFQQADISISPYREASQSGVIATAYATGVPVIVTPVGGLVEQVKHEQTGLICDAPTPIAIAAAVRRMAMEPGLLEQCASGALRVAKEELAWPAIARSFSQATQALLAMGPR